MKGGRVPLEWLVVFALWAVSYAPLKAETLYVCANSPTPTAPYTNWTTAAHTIQDAVDEALPGTLIVVSNGIYDSGGRPAPGLTLTNRVTIHKAVTVSSVNGPAVTIIRGAKAPLITNGSAAVRCVFMTNGAALAGFTLEGGATLYRSDNNGSGGGAWCQSTNVVLSNCLFVGNSAYSYVSH